MNYGYIWVALWIAETLAYQWKQDLHLPNKKKIELNIKKHNPDSSLLIGEIEYGDIIKERYK